MPKINDSRTNRNYGPTRAIMVRSMIYAFTNRQAGLSSCRLTKGILMKLRANFRPVGNSLLLLGLVVLTAAAPLGAVQGATATSYEEVLKSVQESTASVESWSADVETKMTMGGVEIKSRGEMMGSGERMFSELTMEVMGQLMEVKSVLGADGIHWTETKTMGQVQVFKLDMNAFSDSKGGSRSMPGGQSQGTAQDPSKMLENLGKMYEMTAVGNEAIDGTDTHVLEGTIRDEFKARADPSGNMASMGMAPNKVRVTVGTEDGFVRTLDQINTDGVSYMTMAFSGIKINPAIDDSVFEYTVPEGATVTDATEMISQGRSGH